MSKKDVKLQVLRKQLELELVLVLVLVLVLELELELRESRNLIKRLSEPVSAIAK
ncbi:hypothetical protein [Paenibacillus ferrarius]|uniref:hypothetical protein n=1 Tax=Paenibacillus ferrarius TaxID=1469647 RepID=UPI001301C5BC|nr:hypothetical protein [Paenibacillus ferrarius]